MSKAFEYLKERYGEELSRFDHFEQKCARFLTFVTVIIAGITAVAGIRDGEIFNPKEIEEWVVLLLFLFGSFSIICAWGHTLLALKIGDSTVVPRSRETAEYLISVDEDSALNHIYNCYIDTIEKLASEINEKAKNLEIAYNEIAIGAWCLSLSVTITVILEVSK